MEKLKLPNIERLKVVTKHKNESAELCEEIGKIFNNRNCYWLQYRYHPNRLRDAHKAYQVANKPKFKTDEHAWKYFMAILRKT